MIIGQVVYEALRRAQSDKQHEFNEHSRDLGPLRRSWSQHFVTCLAQGFRDHYPDRDKIAVMSKDYPVGSGEAREEIRKWTRGEFGMLELLYDITVFEYHGVRSADNKRTLSAVSRGLWSVESEMAKNSRHALHDFNKLALSNAESKLFIGPRLGDRQEGYLKTLGDSITRDMDNLYVALIPHPKAWPLRNADAMELYSWADSKWAKTWSAT